MESSRHHFLKYSWKSCGMFMFTHHKFLILLKLKFFSGTGVILVPEYWSFFESTTGLLSQDYFFHTFQFFCSLVLSYAPSPLKSSSTCSLHLNCGLPQLPNISWHITSLIILLFSFLKICPKHSILSASTILCTAHKVIEGFFFAKDDFLSLEDSL